MSRARFFASGGWERPVGQTRIVRVDGGHDVASDVTKLPGLGLGQRIEEKAADFLDMTGRGVDYLGPASVGKDRERIPAIGGIWLSPQS
jgi:hypothetical protein